LVEKDLHQMVSFIYLRALLTTDPGRTLSPAVYDDAALQAYRWLSPGAYVSRQIVTPAANSRYVHVYVDVYEFPGVTSITPTVAIAAGGFTGMTEVTADMIDYGDGWKERHYVYDNTTGFSTARLKLAMTTNSSPTTPVFARPRMIFSAL
jgi:hypothetical protein